MNALNILQLLLTLQLESIDDVIILYSNLFTNKPGNSFSFRSTRQTYISFISRLSNFKFNSRQNNITKSLHCYSVWQFINENCN